MNVILYNVILKDIKIEKNGLMIHTKNMILNQKKKLSVGIIVAFSNNYSFNNYSIINFYIYKNNNWQNLSFDCKLLYILEQIIEYMDNYGYQHAILNYLISNIYNIKIKTNCLDILIANLPSKNKLSIKNSVIELDNFYLPYISFPIYCACMTFNNKIKLYNTIRTDDIDLNIFNNDEILNETKKNI
tara:strand:+ start:63 stop:623 length:561 start_codon:yes stop_codon:yes gene_type:complete